MTSAAGNPQSPRQQSERRPVLAVRHVRHEHLGTLATTLAAAGREHVYCNVLDERQLPPFNPADWSGLIVLGGPMNVDETEAFPALATELEWIRAAVSAELPVLGICLGAQLLAKALGSRVFANDAKEIGFYPLELTEAAEHDALFGGLPPSQTVFQWHGDTFELPEGAVHLAFSPVCAMQAFRYGRNTYGLQFHAEVTAEMVREWLEVPANVAELSTLKYIKPDRILEGLDAQIDALAPLAVILRRWVGQL